jgi:hypothetical protein
MTLCFVTNHHKTFFFFAVAEELEKSGIKTVWISTSRRWTEWLIRSGVNEADICDISVIGKEWTSGRASVVGELPEMQVGALIVADRYLRSRPAQNAETYLATSWQRISSFLRRQTVDVVLGEATYAIECLLAQLTPTVGARYLVPHTIRHPPNRFTLFVGWRQAQLATSHRPNGDDFSRAAEFLQEFAHRPEAPSYFHTSQGRIHPRLSWLGSPWRQRRLAHTDPYEWNRPTFSWILRDRLRRTLNGQVIRTFPFTPASDVKELGRPYVLLTLHRQPEASLDVLGYQSSNQLHLVRRLAQEIPSPHMLVVKEHSNGLGDRGWRFYRRLLRLPNVVLVDPFASSFGLMQDAAITLSVSGTSSYEAALQGLPSATFADMFFTEITSPRAALHLDESQLPSLLNASARPTLEERTKFVACLLANSRPGAIGSPSDTPECMSTENIALVADGLLALLDPQLENAGQS